MTLWVIGAEIIQDIRRWLNQLRCSHDYVVEHYDNACSLEKCQKCGHVKIYGRP